MAWVITQPCVDDKIAFCASVCPENCIETSVDSNQYFINPYKCTDCGLCDLVCPVAAIFKEDDVPLQWRSSIQSNRQFFDERR
jgi:ferredoxin